MSDEWLYFIAQCRSGKTHNYDIVEGPMADDTVWNYVNDFLTGRISRKQFWVLAEFKHPTHLNLNTTLNRFILIFQNNGPRSPLERKEMFRNQRFLDKSQN